MRRRLKTTKKTAKEPLKTGAKKAVSAKKIEAEKPVEAVNKGLQVRVISRPKKNVEATVPAKIEEPLRFGSEKEQELEKRLEQLRQEKMNKTKPKEEVLMAKVKTYQEVQRQKQIIMWCGIAFFMILITYFWISNTQRVVKESRDKIIKDNTATNQWDSAVDELSNKINEMKNGLNSIESFQNGASSTTNIIKSASSSLGVIQNLPSSSTSTGIEKLNEEEFKKIDQAINPQVKNKIRIIY